MENSELEPLKRRSRSRGFPSSYSFQSSFTLNNSESEEEYDQ